MTRRRQSQIEELIARECRIDLAHILVTTCLTHPGIDWAARPVATCSLCAEDTQRRLLVALEINDWLRRWRDDAITVLRAESR